MRRFLSILAAAALLSLSACVFGFPPDLLDEPLAPADIEPVAASLAKFTGERFAPGKTAFVIEAEYNGESGHAVAAALAAKLRQAGFAIASEPGKGVEPLRLVLTRSGKTLLVRLSTAKLEAWQAFARNDAGVLSAAAPFTVREVAE